MIAAHPIVITAFDRTRLDALVALGHGEPARLAALEIELERAEEVASDAIPATVVTMNSEVLLVDLATEETLQVTVVFPADADIAARKISVLSPIGLALLGTRENEELLWQALGATRRYRVARIMFQPEAAGRFDL